MAGLMRQDEQLGWLGVLVRREHGELRRQQCVNRESTRTRSTGSWASTSRSSRATA